VADRFEQQWRLGDCPRIADYLDELPADLRLHLLVELVYIDLEHRLRKKLPVTPDDYFREFPELERLAPSNRADLASHAQRRCDELGRTTDLGSPSTELTSDVPRSIGRYSVAGLLDGFGTQADVFLSFHPELLIPVVIKLIKWRCANEPPDTAHRERLVHEGRILAGLESHPHLVRIYDLDYHEGRPFLVLEHVQGRSLDQFAASERLPPRQAAELVASLAGAVHLAHQNGIIHQDINPRNVLIDGQGRPRLIDFGLAWFRPPWADPAAYARPDAGTPRYLSPEQADPPVGPVDPRTDVFGLGGVLFFLLTGQPLYDGTTLAEVLRQAAGASFDAAALEKNGIPKRLAAVCLKALAREPQARFSSAGALAAALRAAVRPARWGKVASSATLFFAAAAGGWLLSHPAGQRSGDAVETNRPGLEVRVWRPENQYVPLDQALPVRSGDELQLHFRVPAGLHIGLLSINGRGELALVRQYPPQGSPAELIFPGPGQTIDLKPPAGTEVLLVCGRTDAAVSEAELQAAWGRAASWPALAPPGRLLRLLPDRVAEEGERPRDFGGTHHRPESDPVARRLNKFREQLKTMCPFFDGLTFAHE
jgi:hypothetical protein